MCARCRGTIRKSPRASHETLLAITLAGLIFLVLANFLPLASLSVQAQASETTLPAAIAALWTSGLQVLAALVAFTTIFAPAAELLALAYVLAQLHLRRRGTWRKPALHFLHAIDEWSMTEVFVLGALVALIKLDDYAEVSFGLALWCLGGATVISIAAGLRFDLEEAWDVRAARR